MEGSASQGMEAESTGIEGREDRVRHVWGWLAAMMFVAFGALLLALLATPLVGFGSLVLVFLALCGVMLLVTLNYSRRNRESVDANSHRTDGPLPGR